MRLRTLTESRVATPASTAGHGGEAGKRRGESQHRRVRRGDIAGEQFARAVSRNVLESRGPEAEACMDPDVPDLDGRTPAPKPGDRRASARARHRFPSSWVCTATWTQRVATLQARVGRKHS